MIEGTVSKVNSKPHKSKPDKQVHGLQINGVWYNRISEYPLGVVAGDTVEFDVLEGTETLIDGRSFKITSESHKKSSPKHNSSQRASAPTSNSSGAGQAILSKLEELAEGMLELKSILLGKKPSEMLNPKTKAVEEDEDIGY